MNKRRFGLLSSITISIILVLATFILRINLIYFTSLGKIPIYFWFILLIVFLSYLIIKNNTKRQTFNSIYLGIVIISFIYLNSMFQWSVECCPEDYETMYDWNASKGLAWMIHTPLIFAILIIQGLIFDYIRKFRLKKNKT